MVFLKKFLIRSSCQEVATGTSFQHIFIPKYGYRSLNLFTIYLLGSCLGHIYSISNISRSLDIIQITAVWCFVFLKTLWYSSKLGYSSLLLGNHDRCMLYTVVVFQAERAALDLFTCTEKLFNCNHGFASKRWHFSQTPEIGTYFKNANASSCTSLFYT